MANTWWRSGRSSRCTRQLSGEHRADDRIFAAIERQGGLSIASLPEYWRYHWDDLGAFVVGGVDGFEIVNCAPKALGFSSNLRRQVVTLAGSHDLMVVGASDNHGWGKVTCVWNVSLPGAQGSTPTASLRGRSRWCRAIGSRGRRP